MTMRLNIFLYQIERPAGSDHQLIENKIPPGDHLGDRMFNLQAGVDFEEIKPVFLEKELDRTRSCIPGGAGDCHGSLPDLSSQLGRKRGTRCFLDDLLMPPLHAAIPFSQPETGAMGVSNDLDLDMARSSEVLLYEDRFIPEG